MFKYVKTTMSSGIQILVSLLVSTLGSKALHAFRKLAVFYSILYNLLVNDCFKKNKKHNENIYFNVINLNLLCTKGVGIYV